MADIVPPVATTPSVKAEPNKSKRQRSPAYPFINLKAALERAKEFYDKEKRNASNIIVAVTHWGYAQKSSGGVQTIAALKSFGLMKDIGSSDSRAVQLTDEALRILLDQREDSKERETLIKSAALLPHIHAVLWKRWGKDNMPSDANLRHELLFTYKFNDDAIDAFIRQYKATISFAKLGASDTLSEEVRDKDETDEGADQGKDYVSAVGDYVQWEPNGILQFREPKRIARLSTDGQYAFVEGSHTGVPVGELTRQSRPESAPVVDRVSVKVPSLKANMREDVFSVSEGNVTFQWPSPLSADSIADIKDWLKILERKVSRPAPEITTEEKNAD